MKLRNIAPKIHDALSDTPVVFIQGPRQCGKSTLARELISASGGPIPYFTLDDSTVLNAATSDPDGFVASLPDRVILDEVQRAPQLFRAIKLSVDKDRKPGRFLLTGSANAMLLPTAAESLAGRMEIITLDPFSQGEIEGHSETFVDLCFSQDFNPQAIAPIAWTELTGRIARGGFPEACRRHDGARRSAWFSSYVTSILERDVRDLASIHKRAELPKLLRLIATRASGLLNLADLARDSGVPLTTLNRHWTLLEAVFLTTMIPAWSNNLSSRLVKSPKVYLNDSGLLCHLLGLDTPRLMQDELMNGAALENFAVMEIVKQSSWSATQPRLHHYRTHKGREVDLVLEDAAGRVVGIEIKKTGSPGANDFKGLAHLRDELGDRFLRGVLLSTSPSQVSFGPKLHTLPISALWRPASQ